MNLQSNIIKETPGLRSLFDYGDDKVEVSSRIEVVGSGNLSKAYKELEEYLKTTPNEINIHFSCNPSFVLTPIEINGLLQNVDQLNGPRGNFYIGKYVGELIKNSYLYGESSFSLDLRDIGKLDWFLSYFKASKENKLNLSIIGSVGDYSLFSTENISVNIDGGVGNCFASECSFVNATINGDVGYSFGANSKNVSTLINGDVEEQFGIDSTNLNAKIKGDVSYKFGVESINLIANIFGDVDRHFGLESKRLKSYIGGNVSDFFGAKSKSMVVFVKGYAYAGFGVQANNLRAIIDGNADVEFGVGSSFSNYLVTGEVKHVGDNKGTKIITGQDARDHPIYKKVMESMGV